MEGESFEEKSLCAWCFGIYEGDTEKLQPNNVSRQQTYFMKEETENQVQANKKPVTLI